MRVIGSSRDDPRRAKHGFTVIELIVSVFILATLVAIILPAIQTARSAGQRVSCANNLREIGAAYHLFVDADTTRATAFKGETAWTTSLQPYLEGKRELFLCQTHDQASLQSVETVLVPSATIGAGTTSIKLELAGEKYHISEKPGPTPGSYYLELSFVILDSRFGMDPPQHKLMILVEPIDGQVCNVQLVPPPLKWDWDDLLTVIVVLGPNGERLPWSPDHSVIVPATPAPRPTGTTLASISTSYGVNALVQHITITEDGGKVLALEYNKAVCNLVTTSKAVPPKFATDNWSNDSAPRHNGMLNVLFVNGGVQAMYPRQLEPNSRKTITDYWLPVKLQK